MSFKIHIVGLPKIKNIKEKELDKILEEGNIKCVSKKKIPIDDDYENFELVFNKNENGNITELINKINSLKFRYHPNIKIDCYEINPVDLSLKFPIPKPKSEIKYLIDYDKLINLEYSKTLGQDELVYTNKSFLEKQRNMFSYFVKKIGKNIFQGKSIMSISLPIFIFDTRSLLEMWVWQNGYCAMYLELAGKTKDPLERIKYTTSYAISKFHLCANQQKPFNPILGETFQCKILDSLFYLEQTSHHPPISNYYVIGKNYKAYGYNEPEANGGANSFDIGAKGNTNVLFDDGDVHSINNPGMCIGGTIIGDRTIKFLGELQIVDKKNDLICLIEFNPDERSFLNKLVTKKETFPDYIKGIITNISKNTKYNKEKNSYEIIDKKKNVLCEIEGEFTSYLNFDGKTFWEFKEGSYPKFYRQDFTLPSDSYFREDLHFLINNQEDIAGAYKNIMEERQRNDRKFRDKYKKK
jgi:hypothetical protein